MFGMSAADILSSTAMALTTLLPMPRNNDGPCLVDGRMMITFPGSNRQRSVKDKHVQLKASSSLLGSVLCLLIMPHVACTLLVVSPSRCKINISGR